MEGAVLDQYPAIMNTSAMLNQLMQDVTNGGGENSAAIMSQIDAYIQQHGGLLQQGNQLPGIDVSNPLQSVVIGSFIKDHTLKG